MMLSLRTRLTFSYILVSLVCIVLISALANLFLEKQFRQYIEANITNQNKQLINSISREFSWTGQWNQGNIAEIGMNALTQGLIIKLKSRDGSVIWDATKHNNGLCREMILHMAQNMLSRYPNWKGGYVETEYPVLKNNKQVGTVQIGYYGPFYFKDSDLAFINALNRILMGVTVFAICIAFFIGSLIAKRVSNPISKVILTAEQIAEGNLNSRSHEKTKIKEIDQLTTTINNLAKTLQQQETLRKRLTADVAHELRTPLTTVQSHLEAMIDGIWKPDIARLKTCHDEITRIGRLVKDLEQLAKYEYENLHLQKTEFDLPALIAQTVLNFEPEFRHLGVMIQFLGENEGMIKADRDKMSQVLINLLSNSLKFTPAGGTVAIRLNHQPNLTVIRVKDTGIGISGEDLPNIFERFYRADQSRNRLSGGSGIGLAITKAIIEAHQGTISVQSELGKGTEFFVSLPND